MTENVIKYTLFDVDKDINYIKLNKILNFKIEKTTGFYIYGSYGVGKTTFLNKIKENVTVLNESNYENAILKTKEMAEKEPDLIKKMDILSKIKYPKNIQIYYMNIGELISSFQQSWNSKENYINPIKNLSSADVLILDDIGTEFMHDSTSSFIYELFEKRYEFIDKNKNLKLMTIIASNLKLEDLAFKWKKHIDQVKVDRIISRIKGIVEFYFNFSGVDKRDLSNKEKLNNLTIERTIE